MSELLTKILITRAANTNQQLLFKRNLTHCPTVFCSFLVLQLRYKKNGLLLAKTALSCCCWTLTHGHPSGFWQKKSWKKKGPGPLGISVTWTATGLMSVWFKTGEWPSTL
jgi:hypothetical protein